MERIRESADGAGFGRGRMGQGQEEGGWGRVRESEDGNSSGDKGEDEQGRQE